MPPRKRARLSQATSPQATTPEPIAKPSDADVLAHPWTDEEEIGLYKGLIKWKPTGIHKHFRMLQLREYLLENNYIHRKSEHTQIAGLWQKLHTLYDLEALDQREDARQLSDLSDQGEGDEDEDIEDDAFSTAENKVHNQIFQLPEDEYGEQMWRQRLASDKEQRDESPPTLPELNLVERAPVKFTPSFSIEPEETPRARGGRQSRGGAKPKAVSRRQSTRKESVAESGSGDEDESAAEEEEEGEEAEEGSETSAPATRGRPKSGRGRGRPRGRRR